MMSIRRNLLVWLLGALALIGVAASVWTYLEANEDISELFDYQLQQIALSLRHHRILPQPPHPADPEDQDDLGDFITQIRSPDGKLLYASDPKVRLPHYAQQGLQTRQWQGVSYRIFVTATPERSVLVAQPVAARKAVAAEVALRILVPVLVLIPFLGLVIRYGILRGLKPLDAIGNALARRTPADLMPVSATGLPRELMPMVSQLNDLLARLGRAMELQRQFVGDAAHELRTPLTAVQLQLQVLERAETEEERRSALERLSAGVVRATRLVEQLLALARAEPDGAATEMGGVALEQVIQRVVAERAELALAKGVDLGITRLEPVTVWGDEESLRVMAGNLVGNAIRYTPAGGRADVQVFAAGGDAALEVEDNGPGISADLRGRVFDRFHRGVGCNGSGSGLGLAIVRAIVERHRGTVVLDDGREGRGLRVSVRLPRATKP